jgi:hypothetical protein
MPTKTTELIPGRVSFTLAQGLLSLEERDNTSNTMLNLMNNAPDVPLYHHIIYLSSAQVPLNFSELFTSASREILSHPRIGWLFLISSNKALMFVSDVVFQITKVRNRHFQTLEEAIEFLKEVDSTIDWSQMNQDISGLS